MTKRNDIYWVSMQWESLKRGSEREKEKISFDWEPRLAVYTGVGTTMAVYENFRSNASTSETLAEQNKRSVNSRIEFDIVQQIPDDVNGTPHRTSQRHVER